MELNKIRQAIRNILSESKILEEQSGNISHDIYHNAADLDIYEDQSNFDIDEERVTNTSAHEYVQKLEPFVASHMFAEDIGDLGQVYAVYSYDVPIYVHYKDKWYRNQDDYVNPDGTRNEFHDAHLSNAKPTHETHGVSGRYLETFISRFMKKHGIAGLDHTEAKPGEKN